MLPQPKKKTYSTFRAMKALDFAFVARAPSATPTRTSREKKPRLLRLLMEILLIMGQFYLFGTSELTLQKFITTPGWGKRRMMKM
jgi:hypothetical protein